MNQVIRCKNLNIFESIFGGNAILFNLFKECVIDLKTDAANQSTVVVDNNSSGRVANQSTVDVDNNSSDRVANQSSIGEKRRLNNDEVEEEENEENIPSKVDENEENVSPNIKMFYHIDNLDRLLNEIHDKLTIEEVKERIKIFLLKLKEDMNIESFKLLKHKLVLNSVFAVVVSRFPFLREPTDSGFVSSF